MGWSYINGKIVADDQKDIEGLQGAGVTSQTSSGKVTNGIQTGNIPSGKTSLGTALNAASSSKNAGSAFSSNESYINDYYNNLQKQSDLKAQQEINSGVTNLKDALNEALPQYQTQRQTADYNTSKNALSLKESLANMGDRGGMARQDILQNQTAGQNNINSINLQEQKLKDDTAKQISALITNGNLQAAIEAASISAQKGQALIEERNRLQTNQYNEAQDKIQNAYTEAGLTGYMPNGKATLPNQQYQSNKAISEGELMGTYNGKDTLNKQAQDATNAYNNKQQALSIWQTQGTTNKNTGSTLGIEPGTLTSDQAYKNDQTALDKQQLAISASKVNTSASKTSANTYTKDALYSEAKNIYNDNGSSAQDVYDYLSSKGIASDRVTGIMSALGISADQVNTANVVSQVKGLKGTTSTSDVFDKVAEYADGDLATFTNILLNAGYKQYQIDLYLGTGVAKNMPGSR